jgi:dipeptide/tripeptide permease
MNLQEVPATWFWNFELFICVGFAPAFQNSRKSKYNISLMKFGLGLTGLGFGFSVWEYGDNTRAQLFRVHYVLADFNFFYFILGELCISR